MCCAVCGGDLPLFCVCLPVLDAGNEALTWPWTQKCNSPTPDSCDSGLYVHDVDTCVAFAEKVKKVCICGLDDRLGTSLNVLCDLLRAI